MPLRNDAITLIWVAATTILFLFLLSPYAAPLVWAIVFAIVFHPVTSWLARRTRLGDTGSALVTLLASCCLVIAPALMVLGVMSRDVATWAQKFSGQPLDYVSWLDAIRARLPDWLNSRIDHIEPERMAAIQARLVSGLESVASSISGYVLELGQNTALFVVALGVMIYLLFFFLRDGSYILETVVRHVPLDKTFKSSLVRSLGGVVRATIQGNLVIAIIQGSMGGVTLWALGVPGAFILGMLMAAFSLLPAVGAPVVWAPVAAVLAINGQWLDAAVLVAVGAVIIGSVDNFLRPPLVSKGAEMPDYLVFLATIGGIALFGVTGFVVGPVIAATFLTTWKFYAAPLGSAESDAQ